MTSLTQLRRFGPAALLLAAQALLAAAPAGANGAAAGDAAALRDRVRAWRAAHEKEVVRELADLLAPPNLAANREEIEANARHLVGMLERRGIAARVLRTGEAPPTVYGELRVPGAKRTVIF